MRALGLDLGSKTIGLALSDSEGVIASPMGVVSRRGVVADLAALLELVTTKAVKHVVLGLPLELDGRVGHRAKRVQRFARELEETLAAKAPGVVLELWDERFSSKAAERTLLEADLRRQQRRDKIDALAAQFLLQGWLDAQHHGKQEQP